MTEPEAKPAKEVQRWADEAMFHSEPVSVHDAGVVVPKVHLLWMTPDPLGAAAAMNMMYRGLVVRDMVEITDEERRRVLTDMARTKLNTPLEAIQLHFMVENVTRSFTHQMVRQRTGTYAQESMRFAVVDQEEWTDRCSQPPSIENEYRQGLWDAAIQHAESSYLALIEDGVPAEDARGLMPHAMTTRINYLTDMRNFVAEAGKRLCTQAQFEWRTAIIQMVECIRKYNPDGSAFFAEDHWQFEAIADSWMFRPICYQTGKCEFMSTADRFCTIRERVEAFHDNGVGPELWDARDHLAEMHRKGLPGIFPAEWLVDSTAARRESGKGMH